MLLNQDQWNHVKGEFAKLNFDFRDINVDEALTIRNGFYMTTMIDLEYANVNADIFGALFTIRSRENDEKPFIETIYATFLNKLSNGTTTPIAEKSYDLTDGALPTKEQMFSDLNEIIRIQKAQEKFGMDTDQTRANKLRPGR